VFGVLFLSFLTFSQHDTAGSNTTSKKPCAFTGVCRVFGGLEGVLQGLEVVIECLERL